MREGCEGARTKTYLGVDVMECYVMVSPVIHVNDLQGWRQWGCLPYFHLRVTRR